MEERFLWVVGTVIVLAIIFFGTMAYCRINFPVCKCGSSKFDYVVGIGASVKVCKDCGRSN